MRIIGTHGQDNVDRLVDVDRESDHILISIRHPENERSGEKIRVTSSALRDGLTQLQNQPCVTVLGRMRKQKLINIAKMGSDIQLWIRSVDAGMSDGWAILVRDTEIQEAFQKAIGMSIERPNGALEVKKAT